MLHDIVEYWRELRGSVHPEDEPTFARHPDHGFNLDFPPPAYIGDILNAPILILDNNGGFSEQMTPAEFPDAHAHDEFREALAYPRKLDLRARYVSPYYRSRNYTRLLTSGAAALVNGVAYRSVDGKARRVEELTKILPSAKFHRDWLIRAVLPLVERGERFLVVHRWGRWKPAADVFRAQENAIFSTAQISKDLSRQELVAAEAFLQK
ncbi:hypothetical protein [Paracoccus yeei]|uniref:hypothetical protein n=1 Tax=Paracoccus yeei TaxID=147645 RepID=UPI001C8EF7E0|nr:hypothetical protein [Paracoccus yeei]MBY0138477.1 hypothetical protein [Paracoccus yeei]